MHPEGIENLLAFSAPEIIKTPFNPNDSDSILSYLSHASSAFIGPGIGTSPEIRQLLEEILPQITLPTVLDADALNIYAQGAMALPEKVIMTPHLGEMLRLLHLKTPPKIQLAFLKKCQHFADEKNVTLVLKGAPTFIFHPLLPIHVSPVGDPGMATAGTGDILTGLIAALLAQGLSPHDAARLGVYIHGVSGEEAALEFTSYCMIATDLLNFFPVAFAFSTR
jgi:NAD(P)H-hydrate epimerase